MVRFQVEGRVRNNPVRLRTTADKFKNSGRDKLIYEKSMMFKRIRHGTTGTACAVFDASMSRGASPTIRSSFDRST